MRFFLLALFLIAPMAHAADNAPAPVATKEMPVSGNAAWRSLNISARREILAAWKALPEATRPTFPAFRDGQIEKMLAPAKSIKKN